MAWFRKKNRNRRLDRRHVVLDVKLRSSQARALRVRWGTIAVSVSLATLFSLYVIWCAGEWALNRFLYENKDFAIQQIDIQTDGVIAPGELRRWAGIKPGANLLGLDLVRVKNNLEAWPQVKSASLERVLPRTLRIRVTEREPVAQAYAPVPRSTGGYDMRIFQLDGEGCVMLPLGGRQRSAPLPAAGEDLPTLIGITATDLAPGRHLDTPQVRAALEFVQAFDRSPMMGLADVVRVDVSAPETLQVTTGQGSVVTLALHDFDQQLRRWRDIYDQGVRQGQGNISTLDLAVPHNIPVQWQQAGVTIPPVIKTKPSTKYRKRNV